MELVMDLHDCDRTLFTRDDIRKFMVGLCNRIAMDREAIHFWDYEGADRMKSRAPPHLKGVTAVQFIKTSNITLHALDDLGRVYLNVFSCKEFDVAVAVAYANEYFGAGWCGHHAFERS